MRLPKKHALAGLALAVAAFAMQPAAAQWYASGRGGVNFLNDADWTAQGVDIKSSYDTGFLVGGAVGRAFGLWRVEGEVTYRQNDLKDLTIVNDGGIGAALGVGSLNGLSVSGTGVGLSGDESALSFMVNVYRDFKLASGITPFIGAGIGIARVSLNSIEIAGLTVVDDSDTVFAYQVGAGASYNITPTTALYIQYQFFGTTDPSFTTANIGGATAQFDAEYQSHSVSGGVRVSF